MSGFKNRFWGIRRLNPAVKGAGTLQEQVEPYVNWKIVAIDDNALLLCKYTTTYNIRTEDLIIIEGVLMEAWLEHRQQNA